MSCNGCRVLRKGCSESCVLRSCLRWIPSPEAQGNATLFLARFFGRSDLLSLVAAVPDSQRSALFQSLLFEACGRTVNPVSGAVGLLSSGNWHVCEAAVETVLDGGVVQPLGGGGAAVLAFGLDQSADSPFLPSTTCRGQSLRQSLQVPASIQVDVNLPLYDPNLSLKAKLPGKRRGKRSQFVENWPARMTAATAAAAAAAMTTLVSSDASEVIDPSGNGYDHGVGNGVQEMKLLNLFV
ncbi:LOB domain-containing protein 37-like [Syzygium oleosum]|uniref:LOB domain-containing protein 37-like n=1 Tax=Syzygium oleosum TaxID=219896 RepID=UPI0011D215C1|nr:LOB domain-containing protein 37-like [Syzygium oleosum]